MASSINSTTASYRSNSFHETRPFNTLPTVGDGNCLIHSIFGKFWEQHQCVFGGSAPDIRNVIASYLRDQHIRAHTHEQLNCLQIIDSRCLVKELALNVSNINVENMADTIEINGEFLGLEHAELIAKITRKNIRVHYPTHFPNHFGEYKKIDFFYFDGRTDEIHATIFFNGINHWEQCESESKLFLDNFADRKTFSQSTLRERLECNTNLIEFFEKKNRRKLSRSSFFEDGTQRVNDTFKSFLRRSWSDIGRQAVVEKTAHKIVKRLRNANVQRVYSDTINFRSPKHALTMELYDTIDHHRLLHTKLLLDLRETNRRFITSIKPDMREWDAYTQREDYGSSWFDIPHFILTFGTVGGAAFRSKSASQKLTSIYSRSLAVAWFKEDNERIKYFLSRDITPVRLNINRRGVEDYIAIDENALKAEDFLRKKTKRDQEAWDVFTHNFKNEVSQCVWSAGVSFFSANPAIAMTQGAKSTFNVFRSYLDPFEDTYPNLHKASEYVSPAISLAQGDLKGAGKALVFDVGLKNFVKEGSTEAGANFLTSSYKGMAQAYLDNDVASYGKEMLSWGLSEGGQKVANVVAKDHLSNSMATRLIRAGLTNSDVVGAITDKIVTHMNPPLNLEKEEHIRLLNGQEGVLTSNLVQAEAGVTKAQEKVDEKFAKLQKVLNDPKSSDKEIKKAQKRLAQAHENLKSFEANRDQATQALVNLRNTRTDLQDTIYSIQTDGDYEKRLECTKKIHAEQQQKKITQELQIQLKQKEAEAEKLRKERDKLFKSYEKSWYNPFGDQSKEGAKYHKAKTKYEQKIAEVNGIRSALGIKLKPAKAAKGLAFHRALDKAQAKLDKAGIAFSGTGVTVASIATSTPKPISYTSPRSVESGPIVVESGNDEVPFYSPTAITNTFQSSYGNWSDIQALQAHNNLNALMNGDYRQRSIENGPRELFDPRSVDRELREMWGPGVLPDTKQSNVKRYPDQDFTHSNIPLWLRCFANGGDIRTPQERIDQNTQILAAHVKAAAKTFGSVAGELRSFGCLGANLQNGKVTLTFDRTVSEKLDNFVSQFSPDMSRVENFHYLEITASIANELVLNAFIAPFFQLQKAKPLIDRVLVRPQGYSTEVRFLESINNPAYRSGLGNPMSELITIQPKSLPAKTLERLKNITYHLKPIASLTKRQIRAITPMELPYLKDVGHYDWFAKNSVRIDQLRRSNYNHPKTFYNAVRREFIPQNLDELKIRRVLKYSGFNTYPKPSRLPSNVVVEFSKKNGGMTFRKLGTTKDQNMLVRVMPGLAEESVVSSVTKGNHLNNKMRGTLRQQYPYVVQRKGREYLTKHGTWIKEDDPALTHIPLEIYKFKGW